MRSRDTARVSFAAAMKYPMNLVEERFKNLKLYGRPVEVIPYPEYNTLKVFTDAIVEFGPDFDTNIRSKYQIRKITRISELLTSLEH